jgi:fucose permease
MILSLWSGISHSPINLVHAGYGVGAILAVQLAKPFIKFDPMDKYKKMETNNIEMLRTNETTMKTSTLDLTISSTLQHSNNIDIRIPYWVSALVALAISLLFLLTQFKELGDLTLRKKEIDKKLIRDNDVISKGSKQKQQKSKKSFIKNLLFGKKDYKVDFLFCFVFK